MIDFVLGALLVVLVVRGWVRGFVREAISLAVLVVGTVLAFRLSTPAGAIVSAMAGTPPDASRFIGGIAVFLLVAVGAAVVSWVLHRGIHILPGLPTVNRLAGAGLALVAGLLLATLTLTVLSVAPVAEGLEQQIDESAIAGALLEQDGPALMALGALSGDRVLNTVIDLQDTVGGRHLVADSSPVVIPPATSDDLTVAAPAGEKVHGLVNDTRVRAGTDPLPRTKRLDAIAEETAIAAYQSGQLVRRPVQARLEDAGIPVVTASEVLGLGVSPASVHEGLLADGAAAGTLMDGSYRRMGVAAVRGPLGLLTVVVLAN